MQSPAFRPHPQRGSPLSAAPPNTASDGQPPRPPSEPPIRNARDAYQRCTTPCWPTSTSTIHSARRPSCRHSRHKRPPTRCWSGWNRSRRCTTRRFPTTSAPPASFAAQSGTNSGRSAATPIGQYKALLRRDAQPHRRQGVLRTGVPGLMPRLHSGMLGKTRIASPDFHPESGLLHFHAQDRRLGWTPSPPSVAGRYQYNPPPRPPHCRQPRPRFCTSTSEPRPSAAP